MAQPMPMPAFGPQPHQQPTPQQMQVMQQKLVEEAARQGITPQQLMEKMRADVMQKMQQQAQQQQQNGQRPQGQPNGQQQGQARPPGAAQQMVQSQVPIQPGPPKPEAIALAKFLKSQDLKIKRALRALQSPAYTKARSKNPLLPEIKDRETAAQTFKQLPMSMLALRVSRDADAPAPKQKTMPGQKKTLTWAVKIEQQQDTDDMNHYVWFYEGSTWRQKAYAVAALIGVVVVVLYPLWPFWAKMGVWYVSVASMGVVAAFIALAIVRAILFLLTISLGPQPGIWIFPNLFEDVGFFDSFKPAWAWRETKESLAAKRAEKRAKRQAKRDKKGGGGANGAAKKSVEGNEKNTATAAGATERNPQDGQKSSEKRALKATVEEADDD
ncbi:MAG: hypothetical protein Q9159_005180 [Coniocarpon cinnabarinum]